MNKYNIAIYFIVVFIVFGCNKNSGNHDHSHSSNDNYAEHNNHDDDQKTINHTVITENYETFVKIPPLVAGKAGVFKVYITKLPEYKPLETGKVTLSIIKGKKGIRQKADTVSEPGVFHLVIQPKEIGIYNLSIELIDDSITEKIGINNIEVFPNKKMADKAFVLSKKQTDILFLKEQAWKSEFEIKEIQKSAFREVISTSGQIMPASGDEKSLVSPFSGIVSINKSLTEGKYVKRGQKILSLTGKGLASDNISVHYTHLKSNLDKAKSNYERAQSLVENKIVSEKEFLEAKATFETAKAEFEHASFPEDGKHNDINANLTGYIKDILVSDGDFVTTGTPLVKIAQNKRLMIRADVSQNHWHCLPNIIEANFITPYDSKLYNTTDLNGKLISYSRSASNSTWSTPVFFEINNKGNLIPGTYIEVFLLSKPIPDIISISLSALIENQGNFFVFVQLSGENYEKREVKTGTSNGKEIEITSGLQTGEYIVTKGTYQVKLASLSSSLPAHGHSH